MGGSTGGSQNDAASQIGILTRNDKHAHDLNFVYKYEAFESKMFDKLTAKKRAINNWQRLRIVLLLLQVCGGRTTEAKKKLVKIDAKK